MKRCHKVVTSYEGQENKGLKKYTYKNRTAALFLALDTSVILTTETKPFVMAVYRCCELLHIITILIYFDNDKSN